MPVGIKSITTVNGLYSAHILQYCMHQHWLLKQWKQGNAERMKGKVEKREETISKSFVGAKGGRCEACKLRETFNDSLLICLEGETYKKEGDISENGG